MYKVEVIKLNLAGKDYNFGETLESENFLDDYQKIDLLKRGYISEVKEASEKESAKEADKEEADKQADKQALKDIVKK